MFLELPAAEKERDSYLYPECLLQLFLVWLCLLLKCLEILYPIYHQILSGLYLFLAMKLLYKLLCLSVRLRLDFGIKHLK